MAHGDDKPCHAVCPVRGAWLGPVLTMVSMLGWLALSFAMLSLTRIRVGRKHALRCVEAWQLLDLAVTGSCVHSYSPADARLPSFYGIDSIVSQ